MCFYHLKFLEFILHITFFFLLIAEKEMTYPQNNQKDSVCIMVSL